MSIVFDSASKTFTLHTKDTTYQMQLGPLGHLLHLYYGPRAEGCFDYLFFPRDVGFSPNPYDLREGRGWSLDTLPQEYSGELSGDYRLCSLRLETEEGLRGADLRAVRHEIRPGKYALTGLPAAFAREDECETLAVTLRDAATGAEVELLYGVYESRNVITRAARIRNGGSAAMTLRKAASACLDLPFGSWELLHFHGRHTGERTPERVSVMNGIQTVGSNRGASSHQHNPFLILCRPETGEDAGGCFGCMLVYSGSFRAETEQDQTGAVRAVMSLGDESFSWRLQPGECFDAPEVILACSDAGLTPLSQTFHRFLRDCLCPPRFAGASRPVLLNSWEASYFDFTAESILALAREAKDLGMDMLVLDDGWFGARNDDFRALGDWFVNEAKLPGGLRPLIDQIRAMGLQFGLWVEPEMVSEDSALYRAHPDWALTVPGRKPAMGRDQLVLDLGRREVTDWLFETFSALLCGSGVTYVKWDMNRHLSDVFSRALPPERQGEAQHRYVLGLYDLLGRLTEAFPDVLFEGCAGGGGRFDAGMLAFSPQIWCSDNTDPIARSRIQRGTSFGYPLWAMASHVSASPNHQTGRTTPLGTRAVVAMTGAFGYELDPAKLSGEEREEIRAQIARFREYEPLFLRGDYFRLMPDGPAPVSAWQVVSEDRSAALLSVVFTDTESNARPVHLRLKGLEPDADYELTRFETFGCGRAPAAIRRTVLQGRALMRAGVTLPPMLGDYVSAQLLLRRL